MCKNLLVKKLIGASSSHGKHMLSKSKVHSTYEGGIDGPRHVYAEERSTIY